MGGQATRNSCPFGLMAETLATCPSLQGFLLYFGTAILYHSFSLAPVPPVISI